MGISLKEKEGNISKLADELFSDSDSKKTDSKKSEKKEKESKKNAEEPKEDSKDEKPKKEKSRHPNGRKIERTIYLAVIVILLVFFFWNPLYIYFPWNHDTITNLAETYIENQGYVKPSETAQPPTEPETQPEEQDESDPSDTTPQDPDTTDTRTLETEGVLLEAGSIVSEVVEGDNSSYGKINRVTFSIELTDRSQLKPKVYFYAWDEDSPDRKDEPIGIKGYKVLNDGEFATFTMNFGSDATFQDHTTPKTFRMALYDVQNDRTSEVDVPVGNLTTEVNIG